MDENKFINGEREIRKKHNLLLLIDLIKYYYDNNVEVKVSNILNSLQDAIVYSNKEKKELLDEARHYFLEEYNIEILDGR